MARLSTRVLASFLLLYAFAIATTAATSTHYAINTTSNATISLDNSSGNATTNSPITSPISPTSDGNSTENATAEPSTMSPISPTSDGNSTGNATTEPPITPSISPTSDSNSTGNATTEPPRTSSISPTSDSNSTGNATAEPSTASPISPTSDGNSTGNATTEPPRTSISPTSDGNSTGNATAGPSITPPISPTSDGNSTVNATTEPPITSPVTSTSHGISSVEPTSPPTTTEPIDPCLSNPCQNNGTCNSTSGSYECQCADGYAGNNCEADKDECKADPLTCSTQPKTYCMNLDITKADKPFECPCVKGFARRFESGSKALCSPYSHVYAGHLIITIKTNTKFEEQMNIDFSKSYDDVALSSQELLNTLVNSISGKRQRRSVFDVVERASSASDVDKAIWSRFQRLSETADAAAYSDVVAAEKAVKWPDSFVGASFTFSNASNGEIDVQYALYYKEETDVNANIEKYLEKECNNTECPDVAGVTFEKASLRSNLDPCKDTKANNCDEISSTCNSTKGLLRCPCNLGFQEIPADLYRCQDINECTLKSDVCTPNSEECINTIGSYKCVCSDGHFGTPSNCIGVCKSNPCQNDGVCSAKGSRPKCKCNEGYSGFMCEVPDDKTDWRLIAIGLGVAAGVLLILIIVILVLTCGRKKSGTKTRASDPKVRYGVSATRSDSQDSVSGVYLGSGSGKAGGGGGGSVKPKNASRYEEPEMRRIVPHDPQYVEMSEDVGLRREDSPSTRLHHDQSDRRNDHAYDNPAGPNPNDDDDDDEYSDVENSYL